MRSENEKKRNGSPVLITSSPDILFICIHSYETRGYYRRRLVCYCHSIVRFGMKKNPTNGTDKN